MTKRKSSPEAVRLTETSQKPPADLARELGVRRNQLYKWKEQLGKGEHKPFRVQGKRSTDEPARLRKELERLKKSETS